MAQSAEACFGFVAKSLHWIVAFLVVMMVPLGFMMEDIVRDKQHIYYNIHKSVGIVVLFLMLIRLAWRLKNKVPGYGNMSNSMQCLIHAFHYLLYLALIVMPLSGWIMSTASGNVPHFLGMLYFPMPGIPISDFLASIAHDIHEISAWAIVAIVPLHVIAAFIHHFVRKDDVLIRMLASHDAVSNSATMTHNPKETP